MKRTNVVLDESLLEKARRVGGEKTYSATINKALEEYVKKRDFWEAYKRFAEEAKKGDFFWPNYLEEIRPSAHAVLGRKKQRISADERRAPRKKAGSRGPR